MYLHEMQYMPASAFPPRPARSETGARHCRRTRQRRGHILGQTPRSPWHRPRCHPFPSHSAARRACSVAAALTAADQTPQIRQMTAEPSRQPLAWGLAARRQHPPRSGGSHLHEHACNEPPQGGFPSGLRATQTPGPTVMRTGSFLSTVSPCVVARLTKTLHTITHDRHRIQLAAG